MIRGEAKNSSHARELLSGENFDLVVVDLELPDGNALGLLGELARSKSEIPVLALSEREDVQWLQRIFEIGARGYVTKQDPTFELILGLDTLFQGRRFVSRSMSHHLVGLFTSSARKSDKNGIKKLSDRELSVFRMIGKGVGPSMIASNLGIAVKTVETHRERIKIKLGLQNGSDLKRKAVEWVISTASTVTGVMSLLIAASEWILSFDAAIELMI